MKKAENYACFNRTLGSIFDSFRGFADFSSTGIKVAGIALGSTAVFRLVLTRLACVCSDRNLVPTGDSRCGTIICAIPVHPRRFDN